MRIVVHGQQAFGKSVLEALLERGENIVGVYCGPDPAQGGRVDPLKEAALARSLPVHQPKSFRNKPEVWEEFGRLKADLCVMAYVTLIVPEEVLNSPTRGTIQYHPSLLPRHRGPSSINWPIIQGETRTGLTIFWPDQGEYENLTFFVTDPQALAIIQDSQDRVRSIASGRARTAWARIGASGVWS
jgi:methionyl-tRNA formyltransferase